MVVACTAEPAWVFQRVSMVRVVVGVVGCRWYFFAPDWSHAAQSSTRAPLLRHRNRAEVLRRLVLVLRDISSLFRCCYSEPRDLQVSLLLVVVLVGRVLLLLDLSYRLLGVGGGLQQGAGWIAGLSRVSSSVGVLASYNTLPVVCHGNLPLCCAEGQSP